MAARKRDGLVITGSKQPALGFVRPDTVQIAPRHLHFVDRLPIRRVSGIVCREPINKTASIYLCEDSVVISDVAAALFAATAVNLLRRTNATDRVRLAEIRQWIGRCIKLTYVAHVRGTCCVYVTGNAAK